jgi:hypothetical protein
MDYQSRRSYWIRIIPYIPVFVLLMGPLTAAFGEDGPARGRTIFEDRPTTKPDKPPTTKVQTEPSPVTPFVIPNFVVIKESAARAQTSRQAADRVWMEAVSEATRRATAIAQYVKHLESENHTIAGSPMEVSPSTASKAVLAPHGPIVADQLLLVADDLIVEIYLNGERVPDESWKLEREVFGAMVVSVRIEVREGDCLVFNVANDPLRWGGSCGFSAAALMGEQKMPVFTTESKSGAWSTAESVSQVDRFIKEPGYLAEHLAVIPSNPWKECTTELVKRCEYTGDTLWGESRAHSVWIKYVIPAGLSGK